MKKYNGAVGVFFEVLSSQRGFCLRVGLSFKGNTELSLRFSVISLTAKVRDFSSQRVNAWVTG